MTNYLANAIDWQFLNEPMWAWAIFFIAVSGFAYAWNGVLDLMK